MPFLLHFHTTRIGTGNLSLRTEKSNNGPGGNDWVEIFPVVYGLAV